MNATSYLAPLTALSLLAAQPASAQQLNLGEDDMAVFALAALPSALRGLQTKCRPLLDANAYMFAQGEALDRRLTATSTAAWPSAARSIARIAANGNPAMGEVLANMPPESLRPMLNEFVAGLVNTRVSTDQCELVDRVLATLDPLPPENLARLMAIAVAESQTEGHR